METKTINIYDFEELSEDVQEKVLSDFRERNEYLFLEECLNESLRTKLKQAEIKEVGNIELRYSLSYSQGDGLSFIGDFEYKGIGFNISLNDWGHRYSHSNTTNINADDKDEGDEDITEEIKAILEDDFKKLYYEICDKLEKEGYAYIEAENDDENIKATIKDNEYKFNVNGGIE